MLWNFYVDKIEISRREFAIAKSFTITVSNELDSVSKNVVLR